MLVLFLASPLSAVAATIIERPGYSHWADVQTQASCDLLRQNEHGRTASDSLVLSALVPPRPPTRDSADALLAAYTRLAEEQLNCPTPLFQRGVLKLSLHGSGWPPKDGPGQMLGVPWREQGLRDLALASRRPGSEKAAEAAALLVLDGGDYSPIFKDDIAPRIYPRLKAAVITNGQMGRLLGMTSGRVGDHATAARGYAAAAHMDPANPLNALHEARSSMMAGDSTAIARWFAAAINPDPRVDSAVAAEIGLIADSTEVKAWHATPATARLPWLQRFWELRAARSFRTPDERMLEHFARSAVAEREYSLKVYPRRYETFERWRNPSAVFDDRGLIFIRHGLPDTSVSLRGGDTCFNESWLYRRESGPLVLHFVARDDVDDWRLIETLANVIGENGATNRLRVTYDSLLGCGRTTWTRVELAESREELAPIYSRLKTTGMRRYWEEELELTTRSRDTATATDSFSRRYGRSIEGVVQAYGLTGQAGARALVVVAAEGAGLVPQPSASGVVYPSRIRWYGIAPDDAGAGSDVLDVPAPRPIEPREYLSFFLFVPVTPGASEFGLLFEHPPGDGAMSRTFLDVHLPDPAAKGLQVSDLVLGVPTGGLAWSSPAGPFQLNPSNLWPTDGTLAIYYEVLGLTAGATYRTSIGVGTGARAQRATASVVADAPVERVIQSISLKGLREGTHDVTLSIEGPDGTIHERRQLVTIRD